MVALNSAESNRARLLYIKEASWAATPASGVVRTVRTTGSNIVPSKETQVSEEIRADRMVPSIIEVSAATAGSVSGELSLGTYDDWFSDFLLSSWSKDMNHLIIRGASVTITDTDTITVTGRDWTDYLIAGRYIKLEGFLAAANNSIFEIDSVAFSGGNTEITITATALAVEGGSAFTKLVDANDLILQSTTAAFTSGNTITDTGAFVGSGLVAGQRVYIEGLGKETGTITVEATDTPNGSPFTVGDGTTSIIFEIHSAENLVGAGNVFIENSPTEATLASRIAAAVNEQFRRRAFRVTAAVSGADVTLTNHRNTGGTIAEAVTGIVGVNFSGGSATKSGFYTVASVTDNALVVAETLSTDANSGARTVTIRGSHTRNPGDIDEIVKTSVTIETGYTDVNKFFVGRGLRIGSFSAEVAAGELVSVEWGFQGSSTTRSSVSVLGSAPYDVLEATATEVLSATANVGALRSNGATLSKAVRSISLEADAALRDQFAVGNKFAAGIGYGRMTINGSMSVYFEDFQFFDDFLDHNTVSLSFGFTDADSFQMDVTIPSIKFTTNEIMPEGIDEDVMEEIEFTAQRDATLNTMIMFDRFSSTWPMTAA